jgi:ADP-ribose pyrophosphatase YjhB (NUDIX family)
VNPTPVSVLIQPVDGGVLIVRRTVEPHVGELALPGGFIEMDETWRGAAAREVREECRIEVDPEAVAVFDVKSAPDGTLLVFGSAPQIDPDVLEGYDGTREADALVVVREPVDLAFSLHTEVLGDWFGDE